MKLVTVIVPIYNVEHYVEKCVKSIQMQDYHELEIILVDDGSQDKSGQILEALHLAMNELSLYIRTMKAFQMQEILG